MSVYVTRAATPKAPPSLTENAIRKRLRRECFNLRKRRSPTMIAAEGDGYMITDLDNNVVGGGHGSDGFTMKLDDCAAWVLDNRTVADAALAVARRRFGTAGPQQD